MLPNEIEYADAFFRMNLIDKVSWPIRHAWRKARLRMRTAKDKKFSQFYSQFVPPGALVFDVGANLGNRSKLFLDLGAEVVAFEPQKYCADFLEETLGRNRRFHLVREALGSQIGTRTMFIADGHVLSSLSQEWIGAVSGSGRFSAQQWKRKEDVSVTSLEEAIKQFGLPQFIKIDVEGFELEVVQGLRRIVKALSLEVVPEYLEGTYRSIEWIETFGSYEFQFSIGESMEFVFDRWIPSSGIRDWLAAMPLDLFGDLYARSISPIG
jgi:FkbM family methyltransferase